MFRPSRVIFGLIFETYYAVCRLTSNYKYFTLLSFKYQPEDDP
jgi:hypothetical protein